MWNWCLIEVGLFKVGDWFVHLIQVCVFVQRTRVSNAYRSLSRGLGAVWRVRLMRADER